MITLKPDETAVLALPLPDGAKLVTDRKPRWHSYPPDHVGIATNAAGDQASVTAGPYDGRSALIEVVAHVKGKAGPEEVRAYVEVRIGQVARLVAAEAGKETQS